jgi:ADP-ribosylation factor related protein 1
MKQVLIIGIDSAGKTTLLENIKSHYGGGRGLPHDKITPTIGMNLAK